MTIEELLNRTEDVEKLADQARHDGRLLSPYEQDIWIAGHASRDAEVERLKKVVRVMAEAMKTSIVIEDTCEECGTFKGVRYEIREIKEALAKAEVILKEGG